MGIPARETCMLGKAPPLPKMNKWGTKTHICMGDK